MNGKEHGKMEMSGVKRDCLNVGLSLMVVGIFHS